MKDHYAIRLSRLEDARAIAGVLQAAFEEYKSRYTPKGYCATTPNEGEILRRVDQGPTWVATYEEVIVGTVSVVPKDDSLYVRSMAILPAARGFKIGERLLKEIEDFAVAEGYRRLFLSTTPFLHRAIRLYEKLGFERNDEPPHDLFGTPLFTMTKDLPNPSGRLDSASRVK